MDEERIITRVQLKEIIKKVAIDGVIDLKTLDNFTDLCFKILPKNVRRVSE